MLAPGERAPDFTLADRDGTPVSLADVRGRTAVVYFYGVRVEKSMYGRKYMGAQRATFIIGPDGRVEHVIPKASPKTHDDEVLAAIGELNVA